MNKNNDKDALFYFYTDAVIGTTIFGDKDLIEFGAFDRSFLTLFQITCGATWVANMPVSLWSNVSATAFEFV
jgi:hypothetical protein